jgi:hypothetical protein
MDNLSTITDISSQIGALELGDYLTYCDDGVLETAAHASVGPTMGNCTVVRMYCVSDNALEAAGANMALGGTPTAFPICGSPVTQYPLCPRIGDDALLRAGETVMAAPATNPVPLTICCGRG